MTDGSARGLRRYSWRIRPLVAGLVAGAALTAGLAAVALGQNPGTGAAPPIPPGRVPNPSLKVACGIRIMLVLDESASMTDTDLALTRTAGNAFVNGLKGTGTQLAIDAFAVRARNLISYQTVTDVTAGSFTSRLQAANNGFGAPPQNLAFTATGNPRSGTNWQDAFNLVHQQNLASLANLVVFVTDGNPNTYQTGNPTAVGGPPPPSQVSPSENTTGWNNATPSSMVAANSVKGQSSRILVLGLGASLFGTGISQAQKNASIDRLRWISGDTEFGNVPPQNPNLTHADYLVSESFAELQTALTTLTAELCGGRLEITKRIQDHHGELAPAANWRFHTTLAPATNHTWLSPALATNHTTTGPTAEASTTSPSEANPLGAALFQWTLNSATARVTVSHIHETERPGYHFVQATCRNVGAGGPIPGSEVTNPPGTTDIPGATLGEGDFRTCDVINRTSLAKLTVVKRCEPSDDPGRFDLHIDPDVTSALNVVCGEGTLPQTLPLGTYTVSETAGQGTTLDHYRHSIGCVDLADDNRVVVPETPGRGPIPVHLTRDGQNVVCTITNVSTQFGQLTVIKHLIPAHDSGRFNLLVNGTAYAHGVTDGGRIDPPLRRRFGTYRVTETGANGTNLRDFEISTTCFDQDGREVGHNTHGPDVSVHLTQEHNQIECTITNERPGVPVARLEVVKHLVPPNDAGTFDLVIGGKAFAVGVGHNGTTGPLEFELGQHTVTERAAGLTQLRDFSISTTCVDKALGGRQVAHNSHGPSVMVDLDSESDDIVCTITNERILEPGGGGEQPPPPGDTPQLAVVKRMHPQASVRELVPITITVHNLGRGTANGVQLRENPPSGMRIVRVANGGTIQHGVAVWNLGNLARGESRTVHATAKVLQTGKHVDLAVATALNADPALSMAALRAHRPHKRHPPPLFTG